jgi:uncharacterized membrane protein
MDERPAEPRAAIPAREWRWLTSEAERWAADGLIDARQRDAIVGRYAVDTTASRRRASFVLTGLGVLVASIAVLLVIGYNWDAIARSGKVAIIVGAVVAAFAVSAVAYARGRMTTGELSAFAGTLLYGNAIWLLAQVFQIRSHYPNGALWWMIGALLAAHLVSSRLIGIEAVVLAAVWIVLEVFARETITFLYAPFGALTIWLAYRVRSSLLVTLSALVVAGWTFAFVVTSGGFFGGNDSGRAAVAVGTMMACALYAASFHHDEADDFRNAWQGAGLFVLLLFLTPFMTKGFHSAAFAPPPLPFTALSAIWPVFATAGAIALFVAGSAIRRPAVAGANWPVLAAFALALVWFAVDFMAPDVMRTALFTWTMVIGFSAVAVAVGVGLIHAGVAANRGRVFAGGIAYVLVFLLVRWIDLLGSMLWSALLLAVTAAGLFALARLWLTRRSARTGAL